MIISEENLKIYSQYKNVYSEKDYAIIHDAFACGSCAFLIEWVNTTLAKKTDENSLGVEEELKNFCEFVFEYAIFREERAFLSDLLNHAEILPYLQELTVILCLLNTEDYNNIALKYLVKKGESDLPLQFCRNYLRNRLNGDGIYNETFLQVMQTSSRFKAVYMQALWGVYSEMETADKKHLQIFIPKDNVSCVILLRTLLNEYNTSAKARWCEMMEFVLTECALVPDSLVQLIRAGRSIFLFLTDISPEQLRLFRQFLKYALEAIPPENTLFTVVSALASPAAPHAQLKLLQSHPEMLDSDQTSVGLVTALIDTLGTEEKTQLIEFCIENKISNPFLDSFISSQVLKTNAQLLEVFLRSSHTKIREPKIFFGKFIERADPNRHELLTLLLQRKDFNLPMSAMCRGLLVLFYQGDNASIEILLSDEKNFQFFLEYEKKNGDGNLAMEHSGVLLPQVLAWIIKHTNRGAQLLLSISEKLRKKIYETCVVNSLDAEQPNVRTFIMRSSKEDVIKAMRDVQTRFVGRMNASGNHVIYAPDFWSRPSKISALRRFQKQAAVHYAFEKSRYLRPVARENVGRDSAALRAARQHDQGLYLQHETSASNLISIILNNHIRSKLHLEGNHLFAKAGRGLMGSHILPTHPKAAFIYLTRFNSSTAGFQTRGYSTAQDLEKGRIIFNGQQLLKEHPHITFIMIGLYKGMSKKFLTLPNGQKIHIDPSNYGENHDMSRIEFNPVRERIEMIYEELFRRVFSDVLKPEQQADLIERLQNPQTEADHQLINDLLAFLPLEWLIPCDIPLRLSYVETVEMNGKVYTFGDLRQAVKETDEKTVLNAIDAFEDIEHFPFVLRDIANAAYRRGQHRVVKRISELSPSNQQEWSSQETVVYYPQEVYEIESIVQLILEDCHDRVYVHHRNGEVQVNCILKANSNRFAAHHAEMVILQYALGIGNHEGKNALHISLPDTLSIPVGDGQKYGSLAAIRDALLAYELTTLLVSHRNETFYQDNCGLFHPVTGRGAANGRVALMKNRLAYQIEVTEKNGQVVIITDSDEHAMQVKAALQKRLRISDHLISIEDHSIHLAIEPASLIARLRNRAICYEGINVITEEGGLLLAKRRGKGLASAGGHHSDKYVRKGIAHGLKSEFQLEFEDPAHINKSVKRITVNESISKTGIYVVPYQALKLSDEGKKLAAHKPSSPLFYADPEEFELNSEVVLTPREMRGLQFYDVMPIAELCQYQLDTFRDFLKNQFDDVDLDKVLYLEMHLALENQPHASGAYKIPSAAFGRITVKIDSKAPVELSEFFEARGTLMQTEEMDIRKTYTLDQSPFALMKDFKVQSEASCDYQSPSLLK